MTGEEQRELFFGLLFGWACNEGDHRIEVRGNHGGVWRKTFFDSVSLLSSYIDGSPCGVDWFFGVLPRNTEGEPVGPIRYLWADLDDKLGGRVAVLGAALPTADIIVDSGNGLHCYWRLTRPVEKSEWIDGITQKCLKVFQQRLFPGCDDTSDLARILRVPGTSNFKDPTGPKEVRLIYVRDKYQHESLDKV